MAAIVGRTNPLAQFKGHKYVCHGQIVELDGQETPVSAKSNNGAYEVTAWRCPACERLHYYDRDNAFDDYEIRTARGS
jgi:hypothetical protein